MATFLESPRFPDAIAFGGTVGPTYLTVVNTVYSGREGRIPAWTQSRVRFDIGRRCMNAADTSMLDAFFRVVKGRAYGFRIKDWTDFLVTTGNGVLVPLSTGVYQLGKFYAAGALSETRNIRKPVAGTVTVYLNAAPLPANAYALDTTTGVVTLASSSVTGVVIGATTQIQLRAPVGVGAGEALICSGLTGADAALLNGVASRVVSVSGSTYTVAVNTTGKTVTAAGTAQWAPVNTDVLAWSGQFDVPVRFDVDEMKKQPVDRNGAAGDLLVDWQSIPLIEIPV